MNTNDIDTDDMPEEIDFSNAIRGLHHIPAGSRVYLPASIEKDVREYFAAKAES